MYDEQQVLSTIKKELSRYIDIETNDIDSAFSLELLEPIEMVELIMFLEITYDLDIHDTVIDSITTVEDLLTLIISML